MCFAKAIPWDTNDMRKKIVSLSNIVKKVQWETTSSNTQMLLFWHRHNPQRVFRWNDLEWEIYLYDIYSLVASLIINLTFHYTFIKFVTNDQEGAKKWGNKLFFYAILALTQFVSVSYILSLTFYLHHVLVLCFLLAFYKNCVDPRPQVLEGLKRVYGLKFL